jgi:hypothetical protein
MTNNKSSDNYGPPEKDTTDTVASPPKRSRGKKPNYSGIPWFGEPFSTVRGETALWIGVISQAMVDALSRAKNPEAVFYKHEAIRWLTGNSKDFILVCLLAGRDPDDVRRKAKRSLVSPIAWRAAPGKGKRYQERKAYRKRAKFSEPVVAKNIPPETGKVITGPWHNNRPSD